MDLFQMSVRPEVTKGEPTGTAEPIIPSSHCLRPSHSIVIHWLRTDSHVVTDMNEMITRTRFYAPIKYSLGPRKQPHVGTSSD